MRGTSTHQQQTPPTTYRWMTLMQPLMSWFDLIGGFFGGASGIQNFLESNSSRQRGDSIWNAAIDAIGIQLVSTIEVLMVI